MPTEAESWEQRHRAILAILRRAPVRRQEELVARLAERGFEVTQSSISRDLRELGVAKVGGRYVVPAAPEGSDDSVDEVAHYLRAAQAGGPAPHRGLHPGRLGPDGRHRARPRRLAGDRRHHRRRRHRLRRQRRRPRPDAPPPPPADAPRRVRRGAPDERAEPDRARLLGRAGHLVLRALPRREARPAGGHRHGGHRRPRRGRARRPRRALADARRQRSPAGRCPPRLLRRRAALSRLRQRPPWRPLPALGRRRARGAGARGGARRAGARLRRGRPRLDRRGQRPGPLRGRPARGGARARSAGAGARRAALARRGGRLPRRARPAGPRRAAPPTRSTAASGAPRSAAARRSPARSRCPSRSGS